MTYNQDCKEIKTAASLVSKLGDQVGTLKHYCQKECHDGIHDFWLMSERAPSPC